MTFLPIVDRELRVAARRRSTHRIRTWTAVTALVVGGFSLFPMLLGGGSGGDGKRLYMILTGCAFGLCLLAGVLLTADCLSEEKRDGTLGLLFLTDLKGYDVVLGKFMAMSLNAFYGLLAILPITGLALLLGGLTGGEFWRMNLALMNALFFSLATGICVSAFGRESQRAMGKTLGVVILFAGGLPALAQLGTLSGIPEAWMCPAWISPLYPFAQALEPMYLGQPEKYWGALLASQLFAWLLLALASRALPHHWQERSAVSGMKGALGWWAQRGWVKPAQSAKARAELLSINPVLWLMSSAPDLGRIAWVIVWVWGTVSLLVTIFMPGGEAALVLSMYGVRPFGFLLKGLVALQTCRFFVEARRSGALELLLCTPLTSQDIIAGQTLALRRSFQRPVITFLVLLFVPIVAQMLFTLGRDRPEAGGAGVFALIAASIYCLRMIADCYAIGTFGMWLALTVKKPSSAPAFTILFILILPSMLCWLDIIADLVFISVGAARLRQEDLRSLLARQYQPAAGEQLGRG